MDLIARARTGPVFIIAEAGVNHNGRLDLALKLVDAAKAAGADAVKFQTFHTEDVISRSAAKAPYQRRTTGGGGSQFEMVKRLELSLQAHERIAAHCRRKGIVFCSTPCDPASVDRLDSLRVPFFKIGSAEVTNHPLLAYAAAKKRPIILSTGMSTLAEVREAVRVIEKAGNRRLVLLHCVTEYPAPVDSVNLNALATLKKAFGHPVGFSDHTLGIEVSLAAVALGARVIEKHLTLDRALPGPDHEASLEPAAFKRLVEGIRAVESALGDGIKRPASCEIANREIARRSVVAQVDIAPGATISASMLGLKRPATGIAPKYLRRLLGRRAGRLIRADEVVTWAALRRGR